LEPSRKKFVGAVASFMKSIAWMYGKAFARDGIMPRWSVQYMIIPVPICRTLLRHASRLAAS
jgi:hypothetical protein